MYAISRLVLIAAAAGLAASVGLLWFTDVPLGVPGEWTWPRIPYVAEHVWGWIAAAATLAVYLVFVAAGSLRIDSCGRFSRVAWLKALAVASFVWLGVVQWGVPGIAGLPKTHFVLYYQRSSGYFWQARYEVADTRTFLSGYEDLLARRDYLHIGTHPPGLTLFFRGLLALLDSSPELTAAVLATEPALSREAAATIRTNELTSGRTFTQTDEAVLWLAALLAQGAAAATVIPLFVLLAECLNRRTAWFGAALWPLVPGIAIFLPKSDAVFPLISTLGPCLWLVGWRKRSLLCCALAGLTLLGGMLLSLAIAPVAVLTGIATVIGEWQLRCNRPDAQPGGRGSCRAEEQPAAPLQNSGPAPLVVQDLSPRPTPSIDMRAENAAAGCGEGDAVARAGWLWWMSSVIAAGIGFFAPVMLLWRQCELNLPRVWSWNVSNHALFYEHNTRTWWQWLLVNPVEAGLAAGGPLAALALIGALRSRGTRLFPLVAATAFVWGLLWISGKNMGEAARLWLLFQPWVVVAAALAEEPARGLDRANGAAEFNSAGRSRVWLALLVLQGIACVATVTRVDGFQFDQM